MHDEVGGEIHVFESALDRCDEFKFTYDTTRAFIAESVIPVSKAAPDAICKTLMQWCYIEYT